MGSSVFSIGLSGLNAANLGLTTAGHNIANANTDGYSRQQIVQSAASATLSGSGFAGMGVKVDTITRSYDQFLTQQLQTTQAKASYYDSYLSHVNQIDNLVADSSAGVTPAIQDYFSSLQNVATNPSDLPSRQAMLSSSQVLVNRFQSVNQQLSEQSASLNGEISNAVASINSYAKQISDINQQVVLYGGTGQTPNDLLDQRDQLMKQLNTMVKATSFAQSDGSINVSIGNGQNLVVGTNTFTLAAVPSPADPQNLTVAYQQNGNTVYLPDNSLAGGQLGAVLDYRDSSLNVAQNSLAQVAMGLTTMINAQQRAGTDLNGNMGQDLFSYNRQSNFDVSLSGASVNISASSSAIPTSNFSLAYDSSTQMYTLTDLSKPADSNHVNNNIQISSVQMTAGYTALGVTVQTAAVPAGSATSGWCFPPDIGYIAQNSANTGNADLKGYISDLSQLQPSDYELGFDGTNYVVTRLSDNTKSAPSSTLPITVDGLTLDLKSGTMKAGDRFTIQPYQGFIDSLSVRITDTREVAAASPMILTAGSGNTGTATLTQPAVDTPSTAMAASSVNPAVKNPVSIAFTSASSFNVTDTVTGITTTQTYTAGQALSVNGWSLTMSGQPAAGDTFAIAPNTSGTADGSNALKLAALQTTKLLSGGTATCEQSYSQMVAAVGTKTNEISIMSKAQDSMLTQAQTARDGVSGVNLDEEAANLLRYQQAYTAASKVIQIAQQVFDEIAQINA